SIGRALLETLNRAWFRTTMTPAMAMKVMTNFDLVITRVLAEMARASLELTAHLSAYTYLDNVWCFQLERVRLTLDPREGPVKPVRAGRLLVIAQNADPQGED
ncbi:hypothetical protein P167DRAFT_489020, partial [Morchella conica CCBAS932]